MRLLGRSVAEPLAVFVVFLLADVLHTETCLAYLEAHGFMVLFEVESCCFLKSADENSLV